MGFRLKEIFAIIAGIVVLLWGVFMLSNFEGSLKDLLTLQNLGRLIALVVLILISIVASKVYVIKKPRLYSKIGHLSAGEVIILGTIRVDQPINAYYSGTPCAFYRAFKYARAGRDKSVICTEKYQASAAPFYLEDDTGRIEIDTENMRFILKNEDKVGAYQGQPPHEPMNIEELLQEGDAVVVEGFYKLGLDDRRMITVSAAGEMPTLYTALEHGLSGAMSKTGKGVVYLTIMTLFIMAFLLLSDVIKTASGFELDFFLVGKLAYLEGSWLASFNKVLVFMGLAIDAYLFLGAIYLITFGLSSYLLQVIALKFKGAFLKLIRWFIEIIALTMMNSLVPMICVFFISGIFGLDPYKAWLTIFISYPLMALYNTIFIPRLSQENEAYLQLHYQYLGNKWL